MTISRLELRKRIKRMFETPNRGISMDLFAQAAGISLTNFKDVFIYDKVPMSESVQIRASRALNAWEKGELAVMVNRDRTRFVQHRKEPQIPLKRHMSLDFKDGKICLDVGVRNRNDYSRPTFSEKLKGK
jgi:hypothetical protein